MVMLNLLPWREYQQKYKNKMVKKFILLSIFLPASLIILFHEWLIEKQSQVQTRIAALNETIKLNRDAMRRNEREQNVSRTAQPNLSLMAQNDRSVLQLSPKTVHRLFTELGLLNINSLCFNEITTHQKSLSFAGQTRSATDLTEFVKQWNGATLFSEIRILKMQQQGRKNLEFIFQAFQE